MGFGGTLGIGSRIASGIQLHLLVMGMEPMRRSPRTALAQNELMHDAQHRIVSKVAETINMPEVVVVPLMADPVLQKMILNVLGDVNTSVYVSSNVVPKGENARVPEKHEKPKGWNVAHPKRTCEGR